MSVLFMMVEGEWAGGYLYQHVCAAFVCGLMAYVCAGDVGLDGLGWVGLARESYGAACISFLLYLFAWSWGRKSKAWVFAGKYYQRLFVEASSSCEMFLVDPATYSASL